MGRGRKVRSELGWENRNCPQLGGCHLSFSTSKGVLTITCFVLMRNHRHREAETLARGHTVNGGERTRAGTQDCGSSAHGTWGRKGVPCSWRYFTRT